MIMFGFFHRKQPAYSWYSRAPVSRQAMRSLGFQPADRWHFRATTSRQAIRSLDFQPAGSNGGMSSHFRMRHNMHVY